MPLIAWAEVTLAGPVPGFGNAAGATAISVPAEVGPAGGESVTPVAPWVVGTVGLRPVAESRVGVRVGGTAAVGGRGVKVAVGGRGVAVAAAAALEIGTALLLWAGLPASIRSRGGPPIMQLLPLLQVAPGRVRV